MLAKQLCVEKLAEVTPAALAPLGAIAPQLLLVFASPAHFRDPDLVPRLKAAFPGAHCVGCSTAGEISNRGSESDSLLINALHFDAPALQVTSVKLAGMADSYAAGERLGAQLAKAQPHTVLIFAPGTAINGSQLIEGLNAQLPAARIAGGLAGDGADFRETFTLCDETVANDQVVASGLASPLLAVGFGSYGGWKPFGPARSVTRADHNVLYELDGEPALNVYKRYLGEHANSLPASGLLFPFSMLSDQREEVGLIRTILAIDEVAGSLVLAGDIYEGGFLQLMHASTDALVDGATEAAESAQINGSGQGFALLISCVGRKLVMGGRTDEEVDAVSDTLGSEHVYAGFHSYGEISPGKTETGCNLYNQTMTIAFLREH